MQELAGQVPGSPVDLNLLNAQGITYMVSGNTITIVSLIAKGDDTNSSVLLNKNTGQQLLLMFYDDSDHRNWNQWHRTSMIHPTTFSSVPSPSTTTCRMAM